MKKYLIIAGALLLGVAVAFAAVQLSGPKALGVKEVSSDPAAFSGTITVVGIMGGVSQQDTTVFGIMDVMELKCTTPNCNKVFLPVKYQGQMPVVGDEVRVTGRFVSMEGGYLFTADGVKVVRHHKIGG